MAFQLEESYIKMMERKGKYRMDKSKGEKAHTHFTGYHISSTLIESIRKHILEIKSITTVDIWQANTN